MIRCAKCGHESAMEADFCDECGRSFADIQAQLLEVEAEEGHALRSQAREGSLLLFLIAALAVGGCMLASSHTSTEDEFLAFIAVQLVLALLFAGLGLWARRNPLGGSVTGLVVYFGIHLLMAVFDPSSLTQGVALHLIVIALLGRAIFGGIKYRELAKRRGWET